MLELKHIGKSYKVDDTETTVLHDISLKFGSKGLVSILGPSGSGKTTLLNIIGGLDKFNSGDLIINGVSTKNWKEHDWDYYRNNSIGFVFQGYSLIPHLSVVENVKLGLTLSGYDEITSEKRSKDALDKVGLIKHIYKRPASLSGGECQRVAIARALINNPEIILADEPTGALDSKNSVRVMDLLKEVSKDHLIIMVTHNQELAYQYSDRIITVGDGHIIDDNMPEVDEQSKPIVVKKTRMGYIEAINLSFKNLLTKKIRTLLTCLACSIGIIGIGLVSSLSYGISGYVDEYESDAISNYPLKISTQQNDYAEIIMSMLPSSGKAYSKEEKVFVDSFYQKYYSVASNNTISSYLLDEIQNIDKSRIYGITYGTGYWISSSIINTYQVKENNSVVEKQMTMREFVNDYETPEGYSISTVYSFFSPLHLMDFNQGFTSLINEEYDILRGHLPQKKDECILVVDSNNCLPDIVLQVFGLGYEPNDEYSFDELMNLSFTWATDLDTTHQVVNKSIVTKDISNVTFDSTNSMDIKVCGILRLKSGKSNGLLGTGATFSTELTEYITDLYMESNLAQTAPKGVNLGNFGASDEIVTISIYPKSLADKQYIKDFFAEYNEGRIDADSVRLSDQLQIYLSTATSLITSVSQGLIALTSITLIVSAIMIGIITYVSVVERTKEIGILRSLGAKRTDVLRVFVMETSLIGLISGIMGVGLSYAITWPISILIENVSGVAGLAYLPWWICLALVGVSMALSIVSGLFPSLKAASMDPVNALKSE